MRGTDLVDTGIEFEIEGTPDDVVALVQRAVEASGAQAASTRHYVAIDGGTSADIRLRVASIDVLAPLLAFAITTTRTPNGTAASTVILQHNVQKRRRHRSLLGEEPFQTFLETLGAFVAESGPRASATVRSRGARRAVAVPGAVEPELPPVGTTPALASTAASPSVGPGSEISAPTTAEPIMAGPPVAESITPEPTVTPAVSPSAAPDPVVPPVAPSSAAGPVSAAVVPQPAAPQPVATAVATPQQEEAGHPSSEVRQPSIDPALQITVPPGLIAPAPGSSAGTDRAPAPAAPIPVAAPVDTGRVPLPGAAATSVDDATVVSSALRATALALELPDGQRIPLDTAVLIGRNPAAQSGHRGARLQAVSDPRMSVSKTHTLIAPGRRSVRVTDLHSTNGTSVTDPSGAVTVCTPGEGVTAEAGSTIGVGEFLIRVVTG